MNAMSKNYLITLYGPQYCLTVNYLILACVEDIDRGHQYHQCHQCTPCIPSHRARAPLLLYTLTGKAHACLSGDRARISQRLRFMCDGNFVIIHTSTRYISMDGLNEVRLVQSSLPVTANPNYTNPL